MTRPLTLNDFHGQEVLKENLRMYISSSKERGHVMDHMLFYGSAGLGKTTLAKIMANEIGTDFIEVMAPTIKTPEDLGAILTNLNEGSILFIDEIHRLSMQVEEVLYPAMEDKVFHMSIGKRGKGFVTKMKLNNFTLVGATTIQGMLSKPLRDRFGISLKLELYSPEELAKIVMRASGLYDIVLTEETAFNIAKRSRGTPRIALNLTRRIRDLTSGSITNDCVNNAFDRLGIDENGLSTQDIRYIDILKNMFHNRPTGIDTIASVMGDTKDTIEDVIESYLLQSGIIIKGSRGRELTEYGYNYIKN